MSFPLTSPQREIWLDQMLYPNIPLYNIGASVEVNRSLDHRLFTLAVQHLAAGHDTLRTVLRAGADASELPRQTFLDTIAVPVPLIDCCGEEDPELAANAWMQAEFTRPFTLFDRPLFRYALLKIRADRYRFFSVYHHLVSDGLGISLLHKRLGRIYAALLAEGEVPFRTEWLHPSYREFIAADRRYGESARWREDLAYWADKYRSLPEPLFRPRQAQGGERIRPSERQVLWIERAFYDRMVGFAKAVGATPFHVMLAALYVWFVRTARRDELAVGLPILNRGGAAAKETVGVFVNMIPARLALGTALGFRALLAAVGKTLKADYRHQRLPIGDLAREIGLYSSGRRHLVDVQLNYAKHDHETETGVFQGRTVALTNDSKQSPLIVSIWELHEHEDVQVDFVYNLAYLDAAEVERIRSGFMRILAQAMDDADIPIGRIDLLGAAERAQLLAWNGPQRAQPSPEPAVRRSPAAHPTLVAGFNRQVALYPDHTALVHCERRLSYAELDRSANRLARCLVDLGVGPETLVGLCVERSPEMVVGLLAILKAGGAYLPLDPGYPKDRLGFMLEDAGVKVLLTQSALLDALPAHTAVTLCIDGDRHRIERFPAEDPAAASGPDSLAYVIYTSGSTGKPKGCMVTHENVTRLFAVTEPLYGFTADDVWTLFHSYAFDFSVWEMWGALLYGGTLVVVPYLTSRDPADFYRLLIDRRVTVLSQTPSAFAQLCAVDDRPDELALRHVVFGGEALDDATLRPWLDRHGDTRPRLTNMYGITETTVHVTYCPIAAGTELAGNIGRPLADLQVWLLDAQGQPVPIGVPGEMYVGGAGVSRGYLGRPELTAERFVETEILGRRERLYRSGDLARQLPDGSLQYLGRIDTQVKLRGFRIELGEIELALTRHPAVREAVVEPRGDGDNVRLVAYLTLSGPPDREPAGAPDGLGPDLAAALRAWLAGRLPDYMLPAGFVVLDRLPLTVNGKVDRKALPAPDSRVSAADSAAPETAAQRMVAEIWCRVLGLTRIGIHDDFFAIGGNSLNGIRFINELNAATGEVFHIYDLFAAPTVARFVDGMAAHYPGLSARLNGETPDRKQVPSEGKPRTARVDLADLRRLLPSRELGAPRSGTRNPRAVFVLAPPRSGTTLLRVMLAGHPGLFAPPELELLGFSSLGERALRCHAHDPFWLQGTVRALMELYRCDAEEAWRRMADLEARDLDIRVFYDLLQETAAGRLLVDKTPFYSVDIGILRRAEVWFEDALYIHLKRHPLGMIHSFEKARMERILSGHPYAAALADLAERDSSARLGELLWLHCNRNILDFLDSIPPERRFDLRFEDLTAEPREAMERLCAFLGLPLHEAMLTPYADRARRMTDGVVAEGRMLGDIRFHTHGKIDPRVADGWRGAYREDFLEEATWSLASDLGYPRELRPAAVASRIPSLPEGRRLPLSAAQQRLRFLAELEGPSATYNIPVTLRLTGELDREALRRAFLTLIERHESLRVCFPAVQGAAVVQPLAAYDPLTLERLPDLPASERQQWTEQWIDSRVHRPFDLENGPLLRVHLLEIGPREHLLLVNMHHIVSDGWSLGVLIREWSALYNAAVAGRRIELPRLPIRYSDYAAWQADWLADRLAPGALATQLAYWREQLADLPQLLGLPTDYPRPPVMRHRGRHLHSTVPSEIAEGLRAIAREQGATLFMTLLAAFNVLLARYSRQDDLAVGTPIANRGHRDTEGLIGLFVNTLVLRTRIDPEQDFTGLLAQVRETALAAYSHQDVPFEHLVEHLRPERSMSHAPLFQVMLMLQGPEEPVLDGLEPSVVVPDYRVAKFDLTLTATERDGGLACTWEYDTDLFRAETIAAMAGRFEVLLKGISADPGQAVGRLPLLTEREWQRLAADNRDNRKGVGTLLSGKKSCLTNDRGEEKGTDPFFGGTVVARFEAQAARAPERVAVVLGERQMTYGELNGEANRLAHRLIEQGVGPETLVGICVERSLDMLVGLLGILKAGGAYLPLDPDQPAERLAFILGDAAVPLLLTQRRLLDRLPAREHCRTLLLDARHRELAAYPETNPSPRSGPDHLAYVIYTSGSTGRPKGCLVTHANVARLFTATDAWFGFGADDVWTLFHSYAFDFSVWEIWGALTVGGQLVIVPYGTSRDPEAFYRLLSERRVTVLNQTPSAFRQLVAVDTKKGVSTLLSGKKCCMAKDGGEDKGTDPGLALRLVIFGGEALDRSILKPWLARHGAERPRLVNMYGITETTVHVTYCPIGEGEEAGGDIGILIPDLRVHLFDPLGQPVPDGVPGEMYVSGAGVARGYLNRPELTAERFIEGDRFGTPFGALFADGERLYRTGDLARRFPDGSLQYLGRVDRQVKLRGFRIELGEIEVALHLHPDVREAAVLLDDRGVNPRLVAYLVPAPGTATAADAAAVLRPWLRERLPEYMVPAGFLALAALPLTGNGKVDRRALAALDVPAGSAGAAAPLASDAERRMAGIWAEVLGLPSGHIGPEDNFFDLGGHSLLATRLVSRIRAAFGADLPLRQVFERPTVGELCRLIAPPDADSIEVAELEEGVL